MRKFPSILAGSAIIAAILACNLPSSPARPRGCDDGGGFDRAGGAIAYGSITGSHCYFYSWCFSNRTASNSYRSNASTGSQFHSKLRQCQFCNGCNLPRRHGGFRGRQFHQDLAIQEHR